MTKSEKMSKMCKIGYPLSTKIRVSVETRSSTGLFLFINLQKFYSQEDINWSRWMISYVNESE